VAALCDGHVASNLTSLKDAQPTPALPDAGYLYTDRPLYYAGDRVHVRGCVRRAVNEVWTTEAGRAHELQVLDPRERVIWRETISLSSFGTFGVEFPLPALSPTGTYRIEAGDDAGHNYHGRFQVDSAPAEPIRVSVDVPQNVYYRGEEITGTIRAAYHYGAPLVNQLVHYQLVSDREFTARTNERGEVPFALSTRNFFADQPFLLAVRLPDHGIEHTVPCTCRSPDL